MPKTITRRKFNALATATLGLGSAGLAGCDDSLSRFLPAWNLFKANHISTTGRVIDNANGNISHSEGQGFGLLLAEAAGDYTGFLKIKAWTDYVLGIRDDSLFAWRYMPYRSRQVPDLNNATDGDILIAWALLRASRRWQQPKLEQQGRRILSDIERLCVSDGTAFGPILKPGADGFETSKSLVVNPSYFVFPALEKFAEATGQNLWNQLITTGLRLLDQAAFGDLNLPPDWLEITDRGVLRIASDYPPQYAWNAIRVPLYIAWAKTVPNDPYLDPYVALLEQYGSELSIPAWINLKFNRTADFSISKGGADIYTLASCQSSGGVEQTSKCTQLLTDPPVQSGQDYYSSALGLLARLAYYEISPESFRDDPVST